MSTKKLKSAKTLCFTVAYLLPYQKNTLKMAFAIEAKRKSNSNRGRRALGLSCPVTLCVCFCVPPSLKQNENPNRSETSVREKHLRKKHVLFDN